MTGGSKEIDKGPKIPLLGLYHDEIIPVLEDKILKCFSERVTGKVVMVKQ